MYKIFFFILFQGKGNLSVLASILCLLCYTVLVFVLNMVLYCTNEGVPGTRKPACVSQCFVSLVFALSMVLHCTG